MQSIYSCRLAARNRCLGARSSRITKSDLCERGSAASDDDRAISKPFTFLAPARPASGCAHPIPRAARVRAFSQRRSPAPSALSGPARKGAGGAGPGRPPFPGERRPLLYEEPRASAPPGAAAAELADLTTAQGGEAAAGQGPGLSRVSRCRFRAPALFDEDRARPPRQPAAGAASRGSLSGETRAISGSRGRRASAA